MQDFGRLGLLTDRAMCPPHHLLVLANTRLLPSPLLPPSSPYRKSGWNWTTLSSKPSSPNSTFSTEPSPQRLLTFMELSSSRAVCTIGESGYESAIESGCLSAKRRQKHSGSDAEPLSSTPSHVRDISPYL